MTSSVTLEHSDYDYDNMELPPSLPNLEIIPFVAADAVVGFGLMDDDVDDDQRLKVVDQSQGRTPSASDFKGEDVSDQVDGDLINQKKLSPLGPPLPSPPASSPPKKSIAPSEEDKVSDKAEEIRPESSVSGTPAAPAAAANQTTTPATPVTPFPFRAFRVTFPPRRTTTVPSLPASLRPKPTLPRSSVKKQSKPSKSPARKSQPPGNNFVRAGGLQIDSCNIYGQMYQVGRIIEELSDACIECKCTEIGVACTNLKC